MTADLHDPDDDGPWVPPKVTPLDIPKKTSVVIELDLDAAPPTTEEVKAEIIRLSTLPVIEYERERDGAAARLRMRKSVIDDLVEIEKAKTPVDGPGLDREPALTPVPGCELIAELVADLTSYISLDPDYAVAASFWVIHTYLLDHTFISPRLAITAPEPRCGKSTLIRWLKGVVQRPMDSVNITAAATYHIVEELRPTLLIDEADTFLGSNHELRGILNSGHEQGGMSSDGTQEQRVLFRSRHIPPVQSR